MDIAGLPTPVFCGVDWAEDHHDIAVVDAGGKQLAKLRISDDTAGFTHRIARKGVESSQRLGRHRWTVERTMAWLAGCRRLHRRYERKADHFLAFTSIACTLICYRRLAK